MPAAALAVTDPGVRPAGAPLMLQGLELRP